MFTTRPELKATFGVAASTHWIASQTAMRMLELGGNAFDAVVAGGFALQVVQPHLNGPAGDLVALAWDAKQGEAFALCGQGPAPAAATIERMTALGHDLIPGTGLLPAVVPGAFDMIFGASVSTNPAQPQPKPSTKKAKAASSKKGKKKGKQKEKKKGKEKNGGGILIYVSEKIEFKGRQKITKSNNLQVTGVTLMQGKNRLLLLKLFTSLVRNYVHWTVFTQS